MREKDVGTVVGTGPGPGKDANQTGINIREGMYYKEGGAADKGSGTHRVKTDR